MGYFEKYLSVWVLACMVAGVAIGTWIPAVPLFLEKLEFANVSIPVAILIWLMIYPMMLKVDFQSIRDVGRNPKGLVITWVTNWLIKPFTMFALAVFFFETLYAQWIPSEMAKEYIAGAVLLGAAPCTAMVFVWSHLTKGNPAYTVVQVASNDLIILFAFAPIVAFLLGIGGITIPWGTLFLSVVLFVVIPLLAGYWTRQYVTKHRGLDYFEQQFTPRFGNVTVLGLLFTLLIIFAFQGRVILEQPVAILLISVPLILQTVFIFFIAYGGAKLWNLPHSIAAPAGMIGASNFFELAVAVSISLFGLESGATLVTVVGVLVEVPVMLMLVRVANGTRTWFGSTPRSTNSL